MSLNDLTNKILADADAEVAALRTRTDDTIASIKAEADQIVRERTAHAKVQLDKRIEAQAFHAKQATAHERRLILETVKRRVLDEAFSEACRHMNGADAPTYEAYLTPLLESVLKDAGDQITHLRVSRDRLESTQAVLARLNQSFEIMADDMMHGGFIATGHACEYDMRFEQLIRATQRACEPEIASKLFTT